MVLCPRGNLPRPCGVRCSPPRVRSSPGEGDGALGPEQVQRLPVPSFVFLHVCAGRLAPLGVSQTAAGGVISWFVFGSRCWSIGSRPSVVGLSQGSPRDDSVKAFCILLLGSPRCVARVQAWAQGGSRSLPRPRPCGVPHGQAEAPLAEARLVARIQRLIFPFRFVCLSVLLGQHFLPPLLKR